MTVQINKLKRDLGACRDQLRVYEQDEVRQELIDKKIEQIAELKDSITRQIRDRDTYRARGGTIGNGQNSADNDDDSSDSESEGID